MKTTKLLLIPVAAFAVVAMLSSCSDNSQPTSGAPAENKAPGEAKAALGEPSQTIEIHATDDMKYDVAEIKAKPGETIRVVLKNIGTMPKESMGHNLVVLTKGTDMNEFLMASSTQARNDYVAPQFAAKVIAHTRLLGPGETDTITFNAPRSPGDYDFLCSFPGHAPAGMKGLLIVAP